MTLLEAARVLAPELAQYRDAHDRERRLAPPVTQALRDRGLLGCLVPAALGGVELDPASYVMVLEALARGDSATAWVAMTASTTALLAGYLPRATADKIWGNGAPFLAGVFAPTGKLEDGVLTGKWSYASGCRHAEYLALAALENRKHVVCMVPAANVHIIDNWDTLGLAGTGSHDLAADGVRVAPDHVCSLFEGVPWPGTALFRVPVFGLLAIGISACALGIARRALEHAAARLTGEVPSAALAGYAELYATLASARAYLLAACDAAVHAEVVDGKLRGELRLAASHVAHRCADVVRGAFHLGGGASVRTSSPLGAALRDCETLITHKMVIDRVLPAAGRALLGIGTPPPDL